jgi:sigma-E factor negative regulatory protein RseA
LLGRLQRDPELRACLGRYHLIGEVMRGGNGATATLGIAARVQRRLADDAPLRRPATGRVRWVRPLAAGAIAASVAMVAVLSVSSLRQSETPVVPTLAVVPPVNEIATTVTQVNATDGEQWERLDPRIDKRLAGYLVNHNEYAASRGVQGVMPYVRIVGHDTSE